MLCDKHLFPNCLLLALLIVLGALVPAAVEASHYRGAQIAWCWDPPPPDYPPNHISFFVSVAERRVNENVGDTIVKTFHFGDGTSEPLTLVVTKVYDGWFRATATIHSHHYTGGYLEWAGLEDCCRISGTGGPGLNNRNDGYFLAKALVYVQSEELCSPASNVPEIIWLSGGLGDTFEIPLAVDLSTSDPYLEIALCRFAGDGEAGGGPNPDGMTIDPATCTISWTPTTGDPSKLWTTQVQAEYYLSYGEFLVATTAIDFLLGLDAAKPSCVLESTEPGPPTRIHVRARDLRSGIASIQILEQINATVAIPAFTPGTTASLEIVGTKINQALASRIRLRITDQAGNFTECDPVLTQVVRDTGKPESQTFGGVPPEERAVTVFNGNPGLKTLDVEVNGRRYRLNNLAPGEQRTLDVGAAVQDGVDSTFTLTTQGKPGGSAVVMIWEGE